MEYENRPIRVLVVEDSPTQARKLELVLKSLGFEIEIARDGQRGFERFTVHDFDLVLSDVLMPGLTGYELCRRIKADPRGRHVPVVLLTGLNKPIDIIRGLECGADNYISKPFQEDVLTSRIQAILAAQKARGMTSRPDGDEVYFMNHKLTITSTKEQILDFLGSTFEDFMHARQREFESALAQEKQNARAETYRIREELACKEKETLQQSHQFLQSTLDALATRIAILEPSGTILAVNTAWRRHSSEDPIGGLVCDVGGNYLDACLAAPGEHARDAQAIATAIGEVVAKERDEYSREYSCDTQRGRLWYSVRVTRFGDSSPVRVVVAHEDITQRKAAEEQLLHEAYHDALTGLPNRALFTEHLKQTAARARRNGAQLFAVLFVDLDGFKIINDSLGHTVGDQLLVTIARRLNAGVRDGDTVARLGGDEFAILAGDLKEHADAIRLAERIQRDLAVPFHLGGHEVFTSASIGIALSTTGFDQPIELLRDADTAMYRAKVLGKAHHVVFDRAMHTSIVARLKLETDLRRAVERDEFFVEYQPIVALETGRISGFEALVRWRHPERGWVSPADFIPAAEETGLIIPLDLRVLREACRQMSQWLAAFRPEVPWVMSVNLSSKHFSHPDLLEKIDRILKETDLDPRSLRLEITESVIMGHTESATALLHRIKERGISLSMDDFGTGYSSLSYLHKFAFDVLKIDRSFVSRIGPRGEHSEIVATIVSLAHNLGMKVVAEGVETAEQGEQLRGLSCQYGQGYYFSRPIGAEQVESLLAREVALEVCALP